MRILGIDSGTACTGYGIIDSDGYAHQLVAAGAIQTQPRASLGSRLAEIAAGLREVIGEFAPETAAIEEVFHAVNVKSALKLAHARGVALTVLAEAGLDCGEYSPLEIKRSVVGYGRAEKQQVQFMVVSLLGLKNPIGSPDACDALAVAICHASQKFAASRAPRPQEAVR